MGSWLERLGRAAFRSRRWAIGGWVVLVAVVLGVGLSAEKPVEEPMSMPGIESQRAYDLIEDRFPGAAADGASATVVLVAPDGEHLDSPDHQAAVDELVEELGRGAQVASVDAPAAGHAMSADAGTAYATVTYTVPAGEITESSRDELHDAVDAASATGLTVEISGDALDEGGGIGGVTEIIGLAVAALVLLLTFGSLLAAGLPLVTAIVGVLTSFGAIAAVASLAGLPSTASTLALMLGLAVGIDYALFILSRYREERAHGRTAEDAASRAVGTAGSAVVFAGATVVIALAGIAVIGIPALAKMGLAAAGAVVLAVAVALTLVPALIGLAPERLAGKVREHAPESSWVAGTWSRLVARRPLGLLVVGAAALGAVAIPAAGLQLGMPGDESLSTTTTQRQAYDHLADAFGPGSNGPLTVVIDLEGSSDPAASAADVAATLGSTDGVVSVSEPILNPAGDAALVSAVPSTGPTHERTVALVETLRDGRSTVEAEAGVTYEITGRTALNIDMADKVQSALVPYVAVVVGLGQLLLALVFRSILVPVVAILGFLLSLGAALGTMVGVFQHGWGAGLLGVEQTGPIMSLMPIFLIGIVFGLAMDYQVFLVSRVREAYVAGQSPADAIASGLRHSSRVVVAAASIMIAVFAGFVGGSEPLIRMIGLGLASAVLFDAFVVRLTLMPAVLHLLGRRAWWFPARLDRWLPHLDVEGTPDVAPDVAPAGRPGAAEPDEALTPR